MRPPNMEPESLKKVASLCRDVPFGKLLSGATYGAEFNIYKPASIDDMELSTPQGLLLALLKSSVAGDVTAVLLLADICSKVRKLRSRHYRVWMLEEFAFPRRDVEKAITLLAQLVAEGILKLPLEVMAIFTSLATKYGINGVQFRTMTEEGRKQLAIQLENAVTDNSARDIFDLVGEGADVSRTTKSGDSLLHLAAKTGNCASIAALGVLGANPDVLNTRNFTPLGEAVRNDSASSVKALLMVGAKLKNHLVRGDNYLHTAAAGMYNKALEALLEGGVDVNEKDRFGETPLVQAAKVGNTQGMKMLLEKGACFNALLDITLKDGDSIFHYVARSGNTEFLKILKDRNLVVNVKNINGLSPLHVASNSSVARLLLRMGVDVDATDNGGCTPLMVAARNTKPDVVSLLLLNRADPKIKDKNGRTALHYAAEGGCVGSVTSLLFAGAIVDDQDNKGVTPALLAASNNKTAVLQLLLEKADLTLRDCNGDAIIHRAARSGQAEVVVALLDVGIEVDLKGQDQSTALHWASHDGHTAVVKVLLDAGAAVDIKDQHQNTPLHLAAKCGHAGVVKELLSYGATVDMTDPNKNTALHRAARYGHSAVMTTLIEAGASVDMKGQDQSTPLHRAARYGHTAVVKALIDAGAAVNMKDQHSNTALQLAARQGHTAAVRALLDARAEVNLKDNNQYTALHYAAERGLTAGVKALLDRGADPSAKTDSGFTPLMAASFRGDLPVVQMLVEHGAPINERTMNGETALSRAYSKNRRAVVDYLRSKGGIK